MTIDLDERFPHASPVCGPITDGRECYCDRDARIAAHIERLEGALRTISTKLSTWHLDGDERGSWCRACNLDVIERWGPPVTFERQHEPDCPVPGIEALMAELGEAP